MTPQAQARFLAWLEENIKISEDDAKKTEVSDFESGRNQGYLDALKDVRCYFTGE